MIKRDIQARIQKGDEYIQILLGPRQCGKSTLLDGISTGFEVVQLDSLSSREALSHDPATFLDLHPAPLLIEEAQYVPELFPELKLRIDAIKLQQLKKNSGEKQAVLYRLTGSDQILMDRRVKESLVGRAAYFSLNTLSVHEILNSGINNNLGEILYFGGYPEIYKNHYANPVGYLDGYIQAFVEKEVVFSAGIRKQLEFNKFMKLLAGRTGEILELSEFANVCNVRVQTLTEWLSVLERQGIVSLLRPYYSNKSKRLTKTQKIYFLDTGLAACLQGWSEASPMLHSPAAGHLFETLVYAEIYKYINNMGLDWQVYFYRTKEKEEIDFIIERPNQDPIVLEAKMTVNALHHIKIPASLHRTIDGVNHLYVVTISGDQIRPVTPNSSQVPIAQLFDFLESFRK